MDKMKYKLYEGATDRRIAKTILIVVSLVIGGLVGLYVGLRAVEQYVLSQPTNDAVLTNFVVNEQAEGGRALRYPDVMLSGGLEPLHYNGLPVGDNYGEQKTANVNKLEPKVSDAYYQWGDNPQKVGLNK